MFEILKPVSRDCRRDYPAYDPDYYWYRRAGIGGVGEGEFQGPYDSRNEMEEAQIRRYPECFSQNP
jgi:hypothetical protein